MTISKTTKSKNQKKLALKLATLTKFKLNQLVENCCINKRLQIKFWTPQMDKLINKLNRKPLYSTARHIKFYKDIKCLKGNKHQRSLPVRGQRTHTNARTAKKRNRPRKIKL